jgi:hypothetical protein
MKITFWIIPPLALLLTSVRGRELHSNVHEILSTDIQYNTVNIMLSPLVGFRKWVSFAVGTLIPQHIFIVNECIRAFITDILCVSDGDLGHRKNSSSTGSGKET